MTSSRFMRIVLVAASVLIIVGVSLLAVIMTTSDDRNHINVSVGDGKSETIEFDNLGLVPGEQCEYRITLKGENARKYDLSLDFSESEENEEKTLTIMEITSALKEKSDNTLSESEYYHIANLIVGAVTEFKKSKQTTK